MDGEIEDMIRDLLPTCEISVDNDGQIIIYTGIHE